MGGGGTGGYRNIGDVDKLLQEAKDRLNTDGRKNLFISFAYEDANEVNLLRGQAKNDNSDLEFNDWTLLSTYANHLFYDSLGVWLKRIYLE